MHKRKKRKKNRKTKSRGNSNGERKENPRINTVMNMPGIWEIIVGVSLVLAAAGMSYFTSSPKILYVGALGVCILIFYATHRLVLRLSISNAPSPRVTYFGELTPSNEPVPPLPRGSPPSTVQLMLGDTVRIFSASQMPVFSKNGKQFLSIGVRNGMVRLTTTLLNKNNEWVCRIIDNEFQVNPEQSFNPKQPDEHSLIVRDSDGEEILNVRFLNLNAIWITGRFQLPGAVNPVRILRDEGIIFPDGSRIDHINFGTTKGGMVAF